MFQIKSTCGFAALTAMTLNFSCAQAQNTAPALAPNTDSWKFDFGSAPTEKGFNAVTPATLYSTTSGFGFEGATVGLTQTKEGVASTSPLLFSVALPEGFYDVTVTLGGKEASNTTVKAEARRLMLLHVPTTAGKLEKRTFTVAIKRPQLASGQSVGLKPSQRPTNWDEKLTLEFNDASPSVAALEIAPAKSPVGVFIAGDSTVTDQADEPFTGWGQMLPRFFKSGVVVWNEAQSGETLSSFKRARLLQKIWDKARPNDYLFIQFGHNDQKDKFEGAGPFTSYKTNLKRYIAEARELKLIPVLVTPMERRRFEGAVAGATLADFAEAVRQTGAEENVPVIDLNAASLKFYSALGPEGSKKAFVFYPAKTFPNQNTELRDNTHHSAYGSYELARIVASGIKDSKLDLAKFLTDDYAPFDAAQPDEIVTLALPISPLREIPKPEGS